MTIYTRIDRGARIEITERKDALPSPSHAPATVTPEGYLIVDAYISRDGLLRYSDGEESWWEYRPTAELERAAASWHATPVTDDHPREMVDSTNYREVSRGIVMSMPQLEKREDGLHYLRAQLKITDAELVQKIHDGKTELSVGFRARVEPTEGGLAADGTRADAVQMDLDGNHVASVDRGRAGPSVRVFLDGADVPSSRIEDMKNKKPDTSAKRGDSQEKKGDQVGSQTEMAPYMGPEGEITLPTWVIAKLQELEAMMQQAAAPEGDGATSYSGANAFAAPIAPRREMQNEEETKDSIVAQMKRRSRLERLAVRAGVEDSIIDSLEDDNDGLARVCAAKLAPAVKLDSLAGKELDVALSVIAQLPQKAEKKDSDEIPACYRPFAVPVTKERKNDAADEVAKKYLERQGY